MNNDNKALFIFGFVFYFIGDLATTYIALINGIPEKGFIRVMGNSGLVDMVIVKVIFFIALYFLMVFFREAGQLSLRRRSWSCCRDGDDGYVDECSGYYGAFGVMKIFRQYILIKTKIYKDKRQYNILRMVLKVIH